MVSEHEFIRNRLAIVEEFLQNGPPEILAKQHRYDYIKNAIEANRYELEAKLLRHILKTTSDGKVVYTLSQWLKTFQTLFDTHYQKNRNLFYEYERWQTYDQKFGPKPPIPPSLRHTDQYGYKWVIDGEFLELLKRIQKGLEIWLNVTSAL